MRDKNINNSSPAGGYIEAWCPSCNLRSGHTVIASINNIPKKVMCNTCEEHHNMRTQPSMKSRTRSNITARKSKSEEATYEEYISRLAGDDSANSRKYNMKGNFEKDEIIDHLKFGIGIVLSVIQLDKIEILFKDGPRLLIQNQ